MSLVWNITRAEDEAVALAAELRKAGLEARALPCIARVPQPWPHVPNEAWLLITSPAALPIPPQARGRRIAALGPKTAAVLRALGERVAVEDPDGAVSLAHALERFWKQHASSDRLSLVYPTSDAAHAQAEHAEALAVLARFADVEEVLAYRVVAPRHLDHALASLPEGAGLVFFSPSAVKNYFHAREAAKAPRPAAVVAHGASTARAWNAGKPAGFPEAVVHVRDTSLADSLRRLS